MKNFIVKTLNGMSHGLFATLIVGVIIQQFGNLLGVEFLSVQVYNLLAGLMGVGIALGIGLVLKKDGLQLVMLAIVGAISTKFILTPEFTINQINGPGNPLTLEFTINHPFAYETAKELRFSNLKGTPFVLETEGTVSTPVRLVIRNTGTEAIKNLVIKQNFIE